ncbi:hypothetical protein L596_002195 [Steinernema carpocapsae]|uniref:Uncharacterized protein n=1 Tax=Steinernema carpocapsae TaxID=34508 RepID=A0A4U8UNF4_STECR|nr:hypothetical protein L596_002195 [Steinernema carpocapsae]
MWQASGTEVLRQMAQNGLHRSSLAREIYVINHQKHICDIATYSCSTDDVEGEVDLEDEEELFRAEKKWLHWTSADGANCSWKSRRLLLGGK